MDSFGIQGLRDQGQIVTESKPKADILNNKFESVFTIEGDTSSLPTMHSPQVSRMQEILSPHLESRNGYLIPTHPRQLVQMAFQIKC